MTPSHSESRFGLGWALAASLLLHALALVAGSHALVRDVTFAPERPVELLRFQFRQPAPETERAEPPSGVVPLPVPRAERPARARAPDPSPTPPAVPEAVPPPAEARLPAEEQHSPGAGAVAAEQAPASPRGEAAGRRFDLREALERFRQEASRPTPERGAPGMAFVAPPLPPEGFGIGNLRFESADYPWEDYARQIYIEIWKAWHRRLYETTDAFEGWAYTAGTWWLRHRTDVAFTIERRGQVTGIIVESPSGCLPLDDSAADALREVILPPLPADFPRERERVHARFIAVGDVRSMRRQLAMMKAAGYF